jgi:iron complex transport system ATP-binding protein|tara:strand:- start:8265 stop:9038 length:774 start_codon:yes stop_codon:yes gene_type:complete
MLAVNNIGLSINGVKLLDDVSLELTAGSVTAVIGPNGAGKTSLLKAITNEVAVSSGSVIFNGKHIDHWSAHQRAAMMAVLAQGSQLNFPFTVEEVVALGRTPHRSGVERDKEIVAQALKLVDCEYLRNRIFTRLSGGEKQRVQFARVLAQIWEPSDDGEQLLVLDEPTASFDLAHQQMMLETLTTLTNKNIAVLIVLHDLNLAISCADQIAMIGCGQLQAAGLPGQVVNPENILRVFGVNIDIVAHPITGAPVVIPL